MPGSQGLPFRRALLEWKLMDPEKAFIHEGHEVSPRERIAASLFIQSGENIS